MFELDETTSVHASILAGAQDVLDLIHDHEPRRPKALGSEFCSSRLNTSMAGIWNIGSKA
jgi:hypothetical protein